MMRPLFLSLFSAAACAFVPLAQAADSAPAPRGDAARAAPIATTLCAACHGADGNSPTAANPKIAGQHAAYLLKQMMDFKAGPDGKAARVSPIKNGIMAAFSEEQMRDFAAYFAAQKQTGGELRNRETLALGQRLYRAGDASKGLPACAACHGPAGAGIPDQYPRIGGQFAEYTEAQMKAFRTGERANDLNKMMRMVAERMTDAEIRAVADYIAGLH